MISARKASVIIASLRSDRLSVNIGAMPVASFIDAYDKSVDLGISMPADLVAFRSDVADA